MLFSAFHQVLLSRSLGQVSSKRSRKLKKKVMKLSKRLQKKRRKLLQLSLQEFIRKKKTIRNPKKRNVRKKRDTRKKKDTRKKRNTRKKKDTRKKSIGSQKVISSILKNQNLGNRERTFIPGILKEIIIPETPKEITILKTPRENSTQEIQREKVIRKTRKDRDRDPKVVQSPRIRRQRSLKEVILDILPDRTILRNLQELLQENLSIPKPQDILRIILPLDLLEVGLPLRLLKLRRVALKDQDTPGAERLPGILDIQSILIKQCSFSIWERSRKNTVFPRSNYILYFYKHFGSYLL